MGDIHQEGGDIENAINSLSKGPGLCLTLCTRSLFMEHVISRFFPPETMAIVLGLFILSYFSSFYHNFANNNPNFLPLVSFNSYRCAELKYTQILKIGINF